MALIVYGTHVFTKFKGYYGMKEECPYCHRKYQKGYVRYSKWVHTPVSGEDTILEDVSDLWKSI